ncbi:MAG: 1-acyl-sn-glycerol-3-phosphate acyltransferase [Myxococcales bacterium]|nr:1-acyl-sn-glycerol-3-phosphate acyltransferase [Myxococcales bacterium]
MPNFAFLPGVDIRFEGLENLPDEPVVFAMNHTDRYNYWPFQYTLWRKTGRFTATWVKGKYFEGKVTSAFLEMTNNIPAASRGYLITRDFVATMKRPPSDEEYKTLRHWVDAVSKSRLPGATANDIRPDGPLPEALLATPRDMMGRPFDPTREDYAHAIDELFREMTRLFIDANRRALETGLDVLIFPQGTRSIRLSRGHIGMAQVALRFKATIVPVGCNGSDHVYPGASPWGKKGHIVYRFGKPIPYEELAPYHIPEAFEPFTPEAEAKHRERFQALTDHVMDRINELLDPPYQYSTDLESDGVRGSNRFV